MSSGGNGAVGFGIGSGGVSAGWSAADTAPVTRALSRGGGPGRFAFLRAEQRAFGAGEGFERGAAIGLRPQRQPHEPLRRGRPLMKIGRGLADQLGKHLIEISRLRHQHIPHAGHGFFRGVVEAAAGRLTLRRAGRAWFGHHGPFEGHRM